MAPWLLANSAAGVWTWPPLHPRHASDLSQWKNNNQKAATTAFTLWDSIFATKDAAGAFCTLHFINTNIVKHNFHVCCTLRIQRVEAEVVTGNILMGKCWVQSRLSVFSYISPSLHRAISSFSRWFQPPHSHSAPHCLDWPGARPALTTRHFLVRATAVQRAVDI